MPLPNAAKVMTFEDGDKGLVVLVVLREVVMAELGWIDASSISVCTSAEEELMVRSVSVDVA